MKWLFCLPLLTLLAVFGCGGSSSPTDSPLVASSPLAECTGALPGHNIAFRGRVVSLQAPTPTVAGTIHGVLIDLDEAAAGPDAQVFGTPSWFEPHTQIWVSLRGDNWPELHPGDCVVGSGRIQGFSCSDGTNGSCDASRFEADALVDLSTGTIVAIDAYGTPKCDDPLLSSDVTFQGRVLSSEKQSTGDGHYVTRTDVTLDRVRASSDAIPYGIDAYAPGVTLTVVLLDQPAPPDGHCVLGTGHVGRYGCGPACDAAGFLADTFTDAGAD